MIDNIKLKNPNEINILKNKIQIRSKTFYRNYECRVGISYYRGAGDFNHNV